jgi:hypothetical protein
VTLLLREVARFLVGAVAWIGIELAIATTVTAVTGLLLRPDRVRTVGVGFVGAIVVAGLAVRLDAPLAWAPGVGGRPLPVVWSLLGAIASVAVTVAAKRNAPTQP